MPDMIKEYWNLSPEQISVLNQLVATKIAGWIPSKFSNFPNQMAHPEIPPINGIEQVRIIPNYMEDMGHAWQVAEIILSKHSHSGSDKWNMGQKSTDIPFASFLRNESSEISYTVRAETMAHAICICALLSIGIDIDSVLGLRDSFIRNQETSKNKNSKRIQKMALEAIRKAEETRKRTQEFYSRSSWWSRTFRTSV